MPGSQRRPLGLLAAAAASLAALALLQKAFCVGSTAPGRALKSAVQRRAEEKEQYTFGGDDTGDQSRDLPPNVERFGDNIFWEVTLEQPFGATIADGPEGPGTGCGINDVVPGGSVQALADKVLAPGAEKAMWVQEGDRLEAVNDISVEGSKDVAQELIRQSGSMPVTLTFSRRTRGAIKVVFPGGKSITAPRGADLLGLAEAAGYDHKCRSKVGRDPNCWMRDPETGEIYILPLNVPGVVPSIWREAGEEGMSPGQGQFESWIPLRLVPAPEEYEKIMAQLVDAPSKKEE